MVNTWYPYTAEDAASHLILDFHDSYNVTIMQCRIENQA